jgi:hydroxymethylpyrimidine pyrophosphatase-like HAD family hydrolase
LTLSAVRLIALDLDGTLLGSDGRVPPPNIEAIRRALDAGIEIVLATGRRFDFARPVFEQLPGPLTLILSNGAIVKSDAGETLLRHLLPRGIARKILGAVPEHRDRAALLFDRPREGQVVYERVDWDHPLHRAFFRANRPFISLVEPLEEALTEDPLQLMFTGGCAAMRELFSRLRHSGDAGAWSLARAPVSAPEAAASACGSDQPIAAITDVVAAAVDQAGSADPLSRGQERSSTRRAGGPAGDGFAVALTEYARRDFSLVDVIRAGCSKGAALRDWARHRGIAPDAVMAVGDNLNDLQMLEFAGHPVVMENGVDELKVRGWRIAPRNDESGVAQVIRQILDA